MSETQLVKFKPDTAFTSTFAYNLFVTEAKKAEAFSSKGEEGFVEHDWLFDFAKEADVNDKYELTRYIPKPRIYIPVTYGSVEHLMPESLKNIDYVYNRSGIFSPIVNNLSPEKLSYYTFTSQTESPSLFEDHTIGNNTISVIPSDLSTLPPNLRAKIKALGMIFEKKDLGIIAIYMFPNIVMLTHKLNKGLVKIAPEIYEIYKEMFEWLEDVHVTNIEKTKATLKDGAKRVAIEVMLEHHDATMRTTREEAQKLEAQTKDYQNKLYTTYANLDTKLRLISAYEGDKHAMATAMVEEIQKVEELPFIRRVEFTPNSFNFYTGKLTMSAPETWREEMGSNYSGSSEIKAQIDKAQPDLPRSIGPFKITIDYATSNILILPDAGAPTARSHWGEGCPHPHINSHGGACWGNASTVIAELHAKREFSMLLLYVINYLKTCNPSDVAGRSFWRWPVAESAKTEAETPSKRPSKSRKGVAEEATPANQI